MAARFKTRNWTLTGGSDNLSTIINDPSAEFVGSLTIRSLSQNVGNVYWRDSGGQNGGHLEPGDGASWNLDGKYVKATEIYFVGTADDTLEITVIG